MPQIWLFQGNPDAFDIDGYLAAQLARITWSVRQRAADIAEGDHVYLWRAQGKAKAVAGIVARATVMSPVWEGPDHEEAQRFWRSGDGRASEKRVWLRVDRVARTEEVLKRDWLAEDPICSDLLVITQRTGTNWLLSDAHRHRIDRLWERTGVDWDRADCVAALWAYSRGSASPLSKDPAGVVGEAAVRTGRPIEAIFEAVRRFRHLDPGDVREGAAGASRAEARTWSEFYDPVAGDLRHDALEAEYLELWGAPVAGTPPTGGPRPAPPKAPSPPPPLPPAPPPGGPPGRGNSTVSRIIRDTNQSRWVKQAHDHTCQVCGIRLAGPTGAYAEGAHIQPLGAEHGGHDRVENLLCLCPNHHVLFDLGAFTVSDGLDLVDVAGCGVRGRLRTAGAHTVGIEFLAYHRIKIAGPAE